MKIAREIFVETSQFDPQRIWNYGCECWETSITILYPEELDHLSNGELLELAENGEKEVRYLVEE